MPTPIHSRQKAWASHPRAGRPINTENSDKEWRCTRCDKLLGVCRGGRMHLRFARGHEYLVGFPVQATCRGCGALNHATAPAR